MKRIFLIILFLCLGFSLFARRSNMSRLSRESVIKANQNVISFYEWKNSNHRSIMYKKYGRGRSK